MATPTLTAALQNDATWQTALFADGPKVIAFLESRPELYDRLLAADPANAKRFYRWRSGHRASFYTIDKVLVRDGGLHPSVLDPDAWLVNGNGKGTP